MLKYKFGKQSINNLAGVDVKLVILISTYLALGKKDIAVTYGVRTSQEQSDIFASGNSKIKKSTHQLIDETYKTARGSEFTVKESNAIDIVAYKNGVQIWEREYYKDIIEDLKAIVQFFGWTDVNFGWDFKSLNDPYHISITEGQNGNIK